MSIPTKFKGLEVFLIKYPVQEPFTWPYFTPVVYTLAIICVVVLTTLNAALVGYETITVFQPDFNISQSFWFDRFRPIGLGGSIPGALCDPRILSAGDSFSTNYSLFDWELVTIAKADSSSHTGGLVYKGSTLETCDVIAIYVDAHLQERSADLAVVITCDNVDGFKTLVKTSFSVTLLSGKYSPPLLGAIPEQLRFYDSGTAQTSRASLLNRMLQRARDDFTPLWETLLHSPGRQPIILSGNAFFIPCPSSHGIDAACAKDPPAFNINGTTVVYSNADHLVFDASLPISNTNTPIIPNGTDIYRATANLVQTVLATVRIDLGNPSPNNVFLNASVLNATIVSTLNASLDSVLYHEIATLESATQSMLPLTVEGPASVQLLYSCRLQQRKPIGSAIVSVLVATLAMYMSGWAIFMVLVGWCMALMN